MSTPLPTFLRIITTGLDPWTDTLMGYKLYHSPVRVVHYTVPKDLRIHPQAAQVNGYTSAAVWNAGSMAYEGAVPALDGACMHNVSWAIPFLARYFPDQAKALAVTSIPDTMEMYARYLSKRPKKPGRQMLSWPALTKDLGRDWLKVLWDDVGPVSVSMAKLDQVLAGKPESVAL